MRKEIEKFKSTSCVFDKSSEKAKSLINRCFNVGSFIITIQDANINLDVLQCKNCWKWGYAIGFCRIQGSKYVKCNSLHKLEHHCQFRWCCKVNDNINSLCLKTKKRYLCLHMFKCVNCKGEYQINSNMCSF